MIGTAADYVGLGVFVLGIVLSFLLPQPKGTTEG